MPYDIKTALRFVLISYFFEKYKSLFLLGISPYAHFFITASILLVLIESFIAVGNLYQRMLYKRVRRFVRNGIVLRLALGALYIVFGKQHIDKLFCVHRAPVALYAE